MGFFEDTLVKAKEAIDVAGTKAGEVIAVQKLRLNAASLNSQITRDFETLGRLVFDNAKGKGAGTDAVDEVMENIDRKYLQLKELEAEIAKAKGETICPVCHTANDAEATYCNRCGNSLGFTGTKEPEQPAAEEETASGDVGEDKADE